MRKLRWIIPFLFIMVSVSSVIAQQCLSVVTDALELASEDCSSLTRNEACYGYSNVTALPNVNPNIFKFEEQGDIAPFDQIAVMQLSPFDEETGDWGVVVARVQAQLPDTVPGQNVTIVMFGGVSLQNDGVDENNVQAFRFSTGIGTGGCLGLPPDGIIIETPDDASFISFEINGTEVTLGSTAFLQTYEDADGSNPYLRIGMIEGLGFISVDGATSRIEVGQQTAIPLDDNLVASGSPSPPGDFEFGALGIMVGFIEGLEFNDAGSTVPQTSGEAPVQATEAGPVETVQPCTISTKQSFNAGLHVGPGENRTRRAWLDPDRDVTVTGISDDGEWWQLDKFEAFPSGANSVVELWVRVDLVDATGDCFLISEAAAPPIIAPPRDTVDVSPTPDPNEDDEDTATEEATEIPDENPEPIVRYWTEDVQQSATTTSTRTCTNINWYVEYVSALYLVGASSQPIGLTGITGSYQVCPRGTTTYYLRVVYTDGTQEDFPITVRRAG